MSLEADILKQWEAERKLVAAYKIPDVCILLKEIAAKSIAQCGRRLEQLREYFTQQSDQEAYEDAKEAIAHVLRALRDIGTPGPELIDAPTQLIKDVNPCSNETACDATASSRLTKANDAPATNADNAGDQSTAEEDEPKPEDQAKPPRAQTPNARDCTANPIGCNFAEQLFNPRPPESIEFGEIT